VLHIDEVADAIFLFIEDLVHETREFLGGEHVGYIFLAKAIDVDGVVIGGIVVRVGVVDSLDGAVLSGDVLDGLRRGSVRRWL